MIDWTGEMAQTFEFREVDPGTWQDKRILSQVTGAEITWDDSLPTGGAAVFKGSEDVGECYIRAYLIARQGGEEERVCLGTFLAQTSGDDNDGKVASVSQEAYTPLLELKSDMPPVCYQVPRGANVAERIAALAAEHCRAPVDGAVDAFVLAEGFTAQLDWTWLDFLGKLAAKIGRRLFPTEEGRVTMAPRRDAAALAPRLVLRDDDLSIVQHDVRKARDYYGVPNVVEVVWSGESGCVTATAVNDDPESPLSIQRRGFRVLHREDSPDLEDPSPGEVQAYADALLLELSTVVHEVTYRRGFVPNVRVGDCIDFDLARAQVRTRAVVKAQKVICETGCQVEETATYTEVVI